MIFCSRSLEQINLLLHTVYVKMHQEEEYEVMTSWTKKRPVSHLVIWQKTDMWYVGNECPNILLPWSFCSSTTLDKPSQQPTDLNICAVKASTFVQLYSHYSVLKHISLNHLKYISCLFYLLNCVNVYW